jgi:hypothetical protein
MVGYTEEATAKLLKKAFVDGGDFKAAVSKPSAFEHSQNSGQNRQRIMMSVRTFKRFCMLAKLAKGRYCSRYYLTMEEE